MSGNGLREPWSWTDQRPAHPATHAQCAVREFIICLFILILLPSLRPVLPALNMKLCEAFVLSWSLLGLEDSLISDLVPGFHSFTRTAFKSSWFLSNIHAVHFQLSYSVSVLTMGINSITILLLKLGIGNILNALISMWLWTPRVGRCWCVSVCPFPSSESTLRRSQCDLFMGWKISD